jgi:hypothetical protein
MDNSRPGLPASLTIATPPPSRTLKHSKSSYFPDRSFRLWANRPYLCQGQAESSTPSDGMPANPPRTPWLAWSIGASLSAAQQHSSENSYANSHTAVELSANEPQTQIRERRRSSMLVSPLSIHRRSLESISSVSRKESSRTASRIGSLIRRNSHSLGDSPDAQSGLISTSQVVGHFTSGYPASGNRAITRMTPRTITPVSRPNTSNSQQLRVSKQMPQAQNLLSQPNSDQFQHWTRPRAQSAIDTSSSVAMDPPSFTIRQQGHGYSYSSAPAGPSATDVRVDTNMRSEAEPEPFVSPIDYALFAEATSSLGFDLLDPAVPSIFQPPPFTQTQSFPLQHTTQAAQPPLSSYLAPLQPSNSQRSRSVPPRPSYTQHTRSISGNSQAPVYSVPREPTRAQLLLEALGLDDEPMRGNDDELPDYETSQREAYDARRSEATRRARELEQNWLRGRQERSGRQERFGRRRRS